MPDQTKICVSEIPAYRLTAALNPVPLPLGDASCATPESPLTPALRDVFDGASSDVSAVAAARELCRQCPMLIACKRYADSAGDQTTFLAGATADERAAAQTKQLKLALRRKQTESLKRLGLSTTDIANLLGVHVTVIRADLRFVGEAIKVHRPPVMVVLPA